MPKKLIKTGPSFDEKMALAQSNMRKEMPNEMATASINPPGMLGRFAHKMVAKVIGGTPVATTGPFGGITYNPEIMQDMGQNEIEDTLAHELTHVKQYNQTPILKRLMQSVMPQVDEGLPEYTKKAYRMEGYDPAYRGKSTEMEAYQTERDRKIKRGEGFPGYDINLRSVKTGPNKKVK